MAYRKKKVIIDEVDEGICNLCGVWKVVARLYSVQLCESCCLEILAEIQKGFTHNGKFDCPSGWMFGHDFGHYADCQTCWVRIRCLHT